MIILVNVKPNSNHEYIEDLGGNEYLAHVKEPAENNKASNKLVNMFAKKFKVNYKKIHIKNSTSRNKIIEIDI